MIFMDYTPLNVMSSYSLLNSTISIDELISTAIKRGYTNLALTDDKVMYGAVEFYDKCIKNNIHPIIGLTFSVENVSADEESNQLIVLAKNNDGYKNIMKLSTLAKTRENENLSIDDVLSFTKDTFIIVPDYGEVAALIKQHQVDTVSDFIGDLKNGHEGGDIFLAISEEKLEDNDYIEQVKPLSEQLGVGLIASSRVQNLNSDDAFALKVMQCIRDDNRRLTNPLGESHEETQNWLKSSSDVINDYQLKGLEECLTNNEKVAKSCHVEISKKQPVLPHYDNGKNMSSKDFLAELCITGLKHRLVELAVPKGKWLVYRDRLRHELQVIDGMGFNDYFLIVWDVINYAHQQNIMTGPGRGSAAGSLVSFCLYITDVDPIEYDLLFERFLNDQRAQMPDIDLDIPDDKREVILNYVHDKYGHQNVAQIVTFDTMSTKQVLRDVGRTFGLSKFEQDEWSKAIPNKLKITLKESYDNSLKLRNLVNDNALNKLMYETATKLEGNPRHSSTHAAGLVLSQNKIVETSPLQSGNEELLITQYSKNYVEEIGLLKIDFLGLKNLSILNDIIQLVRKDVNSNFDIRKINLNDPKTLELFQQGDTNGIFQFESDGIKRVLKSLHPDNFNEVAAVDALYRPGPMENIDTFIARKKGKEKVEGIDATLVDVLGPTYGIIVYQEQVMQVASIMGGFTLGEADLLRRAMSKKKQGVMESMRDKFITGAEKKGYSKQSASQTFEYIERFASYGFNKSHAVAYSKMAFELAYLKAHFSRQFFTGLLNSVMGNHDKINVYVVEAKKRNINVLAPDINKSFEEFIDDGQNIIFGLRCIKGIRSDFIREIVEEREQNGPYKGLEEFISRISPQFRKNDLLKPLIYVGAFDSFSDNRSELANSIDEYVESVNLSGGSQDLFKTLKPKKRVAEELSLVDKLELENKYVGVYLSGHPVEQYQRLQSAMKIVSSDELGSYDEPINCLLFVQRVKTIRTKKGDNMAFVDGTDVAGDINVTVFPSTYKLIANWIRTSMVIMVSGKPEKRNGQYQLIADKMYPAANVLSKIKKQMPSEKWYLKIDEAHNSNQVLRNVYALMKQNHGNHQVVIYNSQNGTKKLLSTDNNLNNSKELHDKLIQLLGNGNVVYK
ncbi:DNA polymerase III subunit alpha [Apilactobacillus kunkeei]|uniref:DNA polymerase III subunit alpha n=1 Tax=Apilactobacillus kunkeei TaxID=148814 RepID=A0A0P7JM31_9LACO|nr:DNA polymerase III subunit alpha [Apilactobacillus kunkeei]KPN82139.1 DNA-directed DNA polymerase III, alpha chain [Apilactobacillus kunkeei]